MSDAQTALPRGCEWWTIGQPTETPPEDELFLRLLTESGISPYTAEGGFLGAKRGHRGVTVIHRGRGRRWHLSFNEDQKDQLEVHVVLLPSKAGVAIEWLNGASLESIRAATPQNEW